MLVLYTYITRWMDDTGIYSDVSIHLLRTYYTYALLWEIRVRMYIFSYCQVYANALFFYGIHVT